MKLSHAILLSILAHAAVIALLVFNYSFSKIQVDKTSQGKHINAVAVNPNQVKKRLEQKKLKERKKKQKELERLRKIKQAKAKKAAEEKKKKLEKQRKLEAEKKRKKRIADEKKLAAKRKKEAEKKRKLEAERKRKQKLAEEKRKKEAERKRKLAEEKAAQEALEKELEMQMAEEMEALNSAKQQQIMSEVDKYNLLISNKIKKNWIEPEQKGYCRFKIKMAADGLVFDIIVIKGDPLHCESGRRAILKSDPLPVSKDPEVFNILKTRTFELENISEKPTYDE